jgi:hypothetical protein
MIDESIIFHVATGSSPSYINERSLGGGVSTNNKDKKGHTGKQLSSTENGQKDGIQTGLLN